MAADLTLTGVDLSSGHENVVENAVADVVDLVVRNLLLARETASDAAVVNDSPTGDNYVQIGLLRTQSSPSNHSGAYSEM